MSDRYDMTMMLVGHNAFRRDLRRLTDAAARLNGDPHRSRAVLLGWGTLKHMLVGHHEGEDRVLWPRMHAGLSRREDAVAVLDAMQSEHDEIDPLIAAVDAALSHRDASPGKLAEAVDKFTTALNNHLVHEERDALPLVKEAMTPELWTKCLVEMRGSLGEAMKAAPEFFPWLLDDASTQDQSAILSQVPAPLRLIYHRVWRPRYRKQGRWT